MKRVTGGMGRGFIFICFIIGNVLELSELTIIYEFILQFWQNANKIEFVTEAENLKLCRRKMYNER